LHTIEGLPRASPTCPGCLSRIPDGESQEALPTRSAVPPRDLRVRLPGLARRRNVTKEETVKPKAFIAEGCPDQGRYDSDEQCEDQEGEPQVASAEQLIESVVLPETRVRNRLRHPGHVGEAPREPLYRIGNGAHSKASALDTYVLPDRFTCRVLDLGLPCRLDQLHDVSGMRCIELERHLVPVLIGQLKNFRLLWPSRCRLEPCASG